MSLSRPKHASMPPPACLPSSSPPSSSAATNAQSSAAATRSSGAPKLELAAWETRAGRKHTYLRGHVRINEDKAGTFHFDVPRGTASWTTKDGSANGSSSPPALSRDRGSGVERVQCFYVLDGHGEIITNQDLQIPGFASPGQRFTTLLASLLPTILPSIVLAVFPLSTPYGTPIPALVCALNDLHRHITRALKARAGADSLCAENGSTLLLQFTLRGVVYACSAGDSSMVITDRKSQIPVRMWRRAIVSRPPPSSKRSANGDALTTPSSEDFRIEYVEDDPAVCSFEDTLDAYPSRIREGQCRAALAQDLDRLQGKLKITREQGENVYLVVSARSGYALRMTNTIGNFNHSDSILQRTNVYAMPLMDLPPDAVLLMVTDGVKDILSAQEIADLSGSLRRVFLGHNSIPADDDDVNPEAAELAKQSALDRLIGKRDSSAQESVDSPAGPSQSDALLSTSASVSSSPPNRGLSSFLGPAMAPSQSDAGINSDRPRSTSFTRWLDAKLPGTGSTPNVSRWSMLSIASSSNRRSLNYVPVSTLDRFKLALDQRYRPVHSGSRSTPKTKRSSWGGAKKHNGILHDSDHGESPAAGLPDIVYRQCRDWIAELLVEEETADLLARSKGESFGIDGNGAGVGLKQMCRAVLLKSLLYGTLDDVTCLAVRVPGLKRDEAVLPQSANDVPMDESTVAEIGADGDISFLVPEITANGPDDPVSTPDCHKIKPKKNLRPQTLTNVEAERLGLGAAALPVRLRPATSVIDPSANDDDVMHSYLTRAQRSNTANSSKDEAHGIIEELVPGVQVVREQREVMKRRADDGAVEETLLQKHDRVLHDVGGATHEVVNADRNEIRVVVSSGQVVKKSRSLLNLASPLSKPRDASKSDSLPKTNDANRIAKNQEGVRSVLDRFRSVSWASGRSVLKETASLSSVHRDEALKERKSRARESINGRRSAGRARSSHVDISAESDTVKSVTGRSVTSKFVDIGEAAAKLSEDARIEGAAYETQTLPKRRSFLGFSRGRKISSGDRPNGTQVHVKPVAVEKQQFPSSIDNGSIIDGSVDGRGKISSLRNIFHRGGRSAC